MFQIWLGNQLKKPNGFLSTWIGKYMEKGNYEINNWTFNLLDIRGNESILEIGIGNGSTLNRVAHHKTNGKNYGVDISKEMVRAARKLNQNFIETGQMDVKQSDIEDLPFDNDIFDKIYTVHTIYFWNDLDKGLREIFRLLKPNGTLFISFTDKSHLKKMKRTQNFNLVDNQELEDRLKMNHFREIKIHNKGAHWCIEAKK
ncbi:class I SAM-dependent methyltransferase [Bacillus sp. CGMCC 1.16607]|uniref:class I SAM-dependent methyltransferase n=1 Tax=Bacillus sp. CGMCC 1.16607 TaxID=3351842 RepID=UPI00362E2B2C